MDELVRMSQQPMTNQLMVKACSDGNDIGVEQKKEYLSGEVEVGKWKVRCTFKDPIEGKLIDDLSHKNLAPQSKKKFRWAVNMYNDWRSYRMYSGLVVTHIIDANLDCVGSLKDGDFAQSLACFITEIKKINGSEYPPTR